MSRNRKNQVQGRKTSKPGVNKSTIGKPGKLKSLAPKFILDQLGWLARNGQKSISGEQWMILSSLVSTLEGIIQTRGKEQGIKLAKAMRLLIFRIVADEFRETLELKQLLVNTDLPKVCKKYLLELNLDHNDLDFVRLVLTLFYSTRFLNLPPKVQLSSIEEAYKGTQDISSESFERFLDMKARSFWRVLLKRETWEPKPFNALYFKSYHLTTKAGPNGHALWRSLDDFRIIPKSLRTSLEIIGGPKIKKHFKVLDLHLEKLNPIFDQVYSEFISKRNAQLEELKKSLKKQDKRKLKSFKRSSRVPKLETKYVRRITGIADQEGKTRTVAIFDYFSQTVLRPLHSYLFSVLKSIPQDCTFSQGSFVDKLKNYGFCASTDLSAFTDRFPFIFNESLIRTRFGRVYATAWKDIMVGYPFSLKNIRDDIKYVVGNPMGAFSSWNSTALAHHFLIYLACDELGIDYSTSVYVLLGDDLVIQDENLNNKYLELLSRYGISFSKEKSHINKNGVLEFAKRFVVRGKEITPFPLNALYVSRKKPLLALNTLLEEKRKAWFQNQEPLTVFTNWIETAPVSSSFKKKTLERSLPIIQLNLAIQGIITSEQALRPILERKYPSLVPYFEVDFEQKALGTLKTITMLMFTDSYENKGTKVLGQLAIDLVTFITGLELTEETMQDLIEAIPVLGVHALFEELYMDLKKELYTIDTLLKGDWKFNLKALALPTSDEIFFLPNKELLMYTSFKMAKYLDSHLEAVKLYPQLL